MKRCPSCSAKLHRETEYNYVTEKTEPVWRCGNCRHSEPRRVIARPASYQAMSLRQSKLVEELRTKILAHDGSSLRPDDYEFEKFDVRFEERFGTVFLSSVVRYKRPGTVGYLFGTWRHISISRGGKVELLNEKSGLKKNRKGMWNAIHGLTA